MNCFQVFFEYSSLNNFCFIYFIDIFYPSHNEKFFEQNLVFLLVYILIKVMI